MVEMDVSLICKALGDSNRLRIVRALLEGEMCACRLLEQFSITQPTLSHHMKVLCDSGIVASRQEGKWTHYRIDPAGRARAAALVGELTAPVTETSCCRCQD